MGRIVVSENVTLDGVTQDPTGDEGFNLGGWFAQIGDVDRSEWEQVEFAEVQAASATLLGRRTYDFFASRWPHRTGEWADRLNSMPKYVVSSSLKDPQWTHTTVLNNAMDDVAELKQRLNGDIVVYASGQLVRTLLREHLVDELRLMICPFVLGAGARLFSETTITTSLRLGGIRTVGGDLAQLTYLVSK